MQAALSKAYNKCLITRENAIFCEFEAHAYHPRLLNPFESSIINFESGKSLNPLLAGQCHEAIFVFHWDINTELAPEPVTRTTNDLVNIESNIYRYTAFAFSSITYRSEYYSRFLYFIFLTISIL